MRVCVLKAVLTWMHKKGKKQTLRF